MDTNAQLSPQPGQRELAQGTGGSKPVLLDHASMQAKQELLKTASKHLYDCLRVLVEATALDAEAMATKSGESAPPITVTGRLSDTGSTNQPPEVRAQVRAEAGPQTRPEPEISPFSLTKPADEERSTPPPPPAPEQQPERPAFQPFQPLPAAPTDFTLPPPPPPAPAPPQERGPSPFNPIPPAAPAIPAVAAESRGGPSRIPAPSPAEQRPMDRPAASGQASPRSQMPPSPFSIAAAPGAGVPSPQKPPFAPVGGSPQVASPFSPAGGSFAAPQQQPQQQQPQQSAAAGGSGAPGQPPQSPFQPAGRPASPFQPTIQPPKAS